MKKCNNCNKLLQPDLFHKSKKNKDGLRGECKECRSKTLKSFKDAGNYIIVENKECSTCLIIKSANDFTKDATKKDSLYSKCKNCCMIKTNQFYKNNPGYKKKIDNAYYCENKQSILNRQNKREKEKLKVDPLFKLKKNISKKVAASLRSKDFSKNGKSILRYLPYSMEELKNHLEKQFEPWMTWDNRGIYRIDEWDDNDQSTWTWQLDHIIPHSTFLYTSMESQSFKDCWALSNLRPLSAKQNFMDGVNRVRHIK